MFVHIPSLFLQFGRTHFHAFGTFCRVELLQLSKWSSCISFTVIYQCRPACFYRYVRIYPFAVFTIWVQNYIFFLDKMKYAKFSVRNAFKVQIDQSCLVNIPTPDQVNNDYPLLTATSSDLTHRRQTCMPPTI